jgi:hypothetical protein
MILEKCNKKFFLNSLASNLYNNITILIINMYISCGKNIYNIKYSYDIFIIKWELVMVNVTNLVDATLDIATRLKSLTIFYSLYFFQVNTYIKT